MKMSNLLLWILVPILSMASTSAKAGDVYVAASLYQAGIDVSTFDSGDLGYSGSLGYTFVDSSVFMLSAEVSYYQLGEFDSETFDDAQLKAKAFALGGVAALPIGPFFEVYGKIGVANSTLDSSLDDLSFNDSWDPYFGVGLSVDVLDTVDIYLEYIDFNNAFNSNVLGVGAKLSF